MLLFEILPRIDSGQEWIDVDAVELQKENMHLDEICDFPITIKRKNNWWISFVYNTTAIIGVGVLGLPYYMVFFGWYGGIIFLSIIYLLSGYTLWQMVDLHYIYGFRFNRYHELAQFVVGKHLGLILIIPTQLIVMNGLTIIYTIVAGKGLHYIWLQYGSKHSFGLSAWMIIFGVVQGCLSQIQGFIKFVYIMSLASAMSIIYCTCIITVTVIQNKYENTYEIDNSVSYKVFGILASLSTVSYSIGGHNILLEIQATFDETPEEKANHFGKKKIIKSMMIGIFVCYIVIFYCFYGVSITCYKYFKADNVPQILDKIEIEWVVSLCYVCIIVHLLASYQIYCQPVFDMYERLLIKYSITNFGLNRIISRIVYVSIITFIAISLPFFGSILSFVGSIGFGPTTFIFPSWFWLKVYKPKWYNLHSVISVISIIIGVLTCIGGSIGALQNIIISASNYKFYQ